MNGEKNGKGKELYAGGKIRFEGEYLNNKRLNGKGYDINNEVVFEIEKGNGKVKDYYSNGKLQFEGEFLNGEKSGKGKEYYMENGQLLFDGEYLIFNGKENI